MAKKLTEITAESNRHEHYKFNIYKKMIELTPKAKRTLINHVAEDAKCSTSLVKNVMYQYKDSDTVPNYNVLKAFAKYFMCTIEKLENE